MKNLIGVPYLKTSRYFPNDINQLIVELNNSYVDLVNAINSRTVGIFPVNVQAVTGENWFINQNQKQQTLRQVYTFTSTDVVGGNITIPHGINLDNFGGFVRIFGSFTDGSIWYPLPYVDILSATNQINVTIDSTNIYIESGGGSPPTISSGLIVLEWLSLP